jgi:hypothetical protein
MQPVETSACLYVLGGAHVCNKEVFSLVSAIDAGNGRHDRADNLFVKLASDDKVRTSLKYL